VLTGGRTPTPAERGAPGRWVRIVPPRQPGRTRDGVAGRLHVVPVRAQGQQVGVLRLLRPASAPPFSAAEDRLLSAVAAQLGLAVERRRLRREATEAEILRRTDELKSALLHAVSHDLKTPLASIIASAGSLGQPDVAWTEQERIELAETIEQEAQRLNRIVGNLLDLSRIEAGSLRPEKGWYDLGALLDDVLGRLRPLTAQHRVSVEVPENLPPVPLDYVEIDQVLTNLIENAVKYSPPGSEVRVTVRCAAGAVEVAVADRGPGIAPEALPHLFEPFYRADGHGPRSKGAGLGLAVARGLVEAHGGRIWAENRADGGARFVFTLPLAAPAPGAGAA
jgi:two-component system sensor histidine kinase KdpD